MRKLFLSIALCTVIVLPITAEARPGRGDRTNQRTKTQQSRARTNTTSQPADGSVKSKFQERTQGEHAPSAQQQANIQKLKSDLQLLKSDSQVTQSQKDQMAHDLRNLAEGTQKPSQQSVDKLATDLSDALADGNLTYQEQAMLAQDIASVMNSANIPPEEVQAALNSAQSILESSNVDQSDVQLIMNDLHAIAEELQV